MQCPSPSPPGLIPLANEPAAGVQPIPLVGSPERCYSHTGKTLIDKVSLSLRWINAVPSYPSSEFSPGSKAIQHHLHGESEHWSRECLCCLSWGQVKRDGGQGTFYPTHYVSPYRFRSTSFCCFKTIWIINSWVHAKLRQVVRGVHRGLSD